MIGPRAHLVFVTAYDQYAVQAFHQGALDYLVKPVPLSRFAKAVQKANELFELRKLSREKASTPQEHVFINANYSLVRVMLDEVLLIEGLKDYVRIWLVSGKEIITRLSLKSVEEKLDPARFMRIHKSYIIALAKIESVQKTQLVIGGREIPIGEGYRAMLQAYLGDRAL